MAFDVVFTSKAWGQYLYWQDTDEKIVGRINALIEDIRRHPFVGIGKPEPLKHELSGYWARRIDIENRLVYRVKDNKVGIIQCRYHY